MKHLKSIDFRVRKISFLFLILLLSTTASAQVAINADGSSPDASAMLDVKSDMAGILIPRMTEAERNVITAPATGLMIYQTDNIAGFYHYDGTDWKTIGSGAFSIDDLLDGKSDGSSVFLGVGSGTNDDGSGNKNVAVGLNSLNANTTGDNNTAIGSDALRLNTSGRYNTAYGSAALINNTSGTYNTADGAAALYKNTIGAYNTALGYYSLYSNTNGSYNVSLGYYANRNRTSGKFNVVTGASSGYYNTSGYNNISLGYAADYYNTSGSDNTVIGFKAGFGTSGVIRSGDIFIGYKAGYSELRSNKLYIQNSDTSKPLIFGDFETNELGFNGKVGIGTHSPLSQLHIHNPASTNTTVYITPKTLNSGDSATLFLAEDNVATFGMYWMYDGSGNEMELWGKAYLNKSGPHLLIKRDNGNVAIGSYFATGYRLSVDGKIMCEEVRVSMQDDWPDYVFNKNYSLLPIRKLEKFIETNGHLPNIPSSDEIGNSGLELGEMQRLMMEKIEELTLYIIEQQKRIDVLSSKIENSDKDEN